MPERPLAGLRVLELARVLAGPVDRPDPRRSRRRRDQGRVPGGGDETRGWGPPFAADGAAAPISTPATAASAASRSTFATPRDRARARRLAAGADVVLENFKVGGLARSGSTMPASRRQSRRASTASVTGFGQDGPLARARRLRLHHPGDGRDHGPDRRAGRAAAEAGVAYADLFTGLYGTIAVLAALRLARAHRARASGSTSALFDTQLAVLANQAANYLIGGVTPRRMGNAHPNIVPYQVFDAADGPLVIACGNDGQFARLCEALGLGCTATRGSAATATGSPTGRRWSAALAARLAAHAARRGAGGDGGGRRAGGADQQRRGGLRRAAGGGRGAGAGDRGLARAAEPDAVLRRGDGAPTCRRRGSTSTGRRSAPRWRPGRLAWPLELETALAGTEGRGRCRSAGRRGRAAARRRGRRRRSRGRRACGTRLSRLVTSAFSRRRCSPVARWIGSETMPAKALASAATPSTPAVAPATRNGEACAGKRPYQRPPARGAEREAGDRRALARVPAITGPRAIAPGVAFWKASAPAPRATRPVVISAAAARVPA